MNRKMVDHLRKKRHNRTESKNMEDPVAGENEEEEHARKEELEGVAVLADLGAFIDLFLGGCIRG